MFEREKISGNNFNDWFRQVKLVLRVEKKMYVIEQPLPAAPAADSNAQVLAEWNTLYDAYNEVACLMLDSMTPELHRQFENYLPYEILQELKSMFEKQAEVERFDLIQTFHACKQEEGKLVAAYVLQMKGYVDQLEHLGYMLPQDLIVGLILNGLTKDFAGFVRNYNMHNMGKTIGELHAMLIEYEKGLPKKVETLQEMMIKGDNYHYAPSITRDFVTVHRLVENEFVHTKRAKHNLDSTYLWHCRLAHISKKRIEKLQQEGLLKSTDDESFDHCVSCLSGKMTRKSFPHRPERATDLLGIIHTDMCGPLRHVSRQEIQDEDTSPSEITSEIPMEVEGFEPPQEEVILIRRSKWIFKKKTDMDGIIHNYKARHVAKGYTQLYGVDYEEMFSIVVNIRAIRILISIAALYDYEIWQIDVQTAFLNCYLDEDIYMVQPEDVKSQQQVQARLSHSNVLVQLAESYGDEGRFVDEIQTIKGNDEGAEFIHAEVNIQLQDFLGLEMNYELVDEFIPSKSGVPLVYNDPLIVIQVTMFKCGGPAFNSSSLFPPRGIRPIRPLKIDATSNKYTRKKLTFNESAITNMKAKAIKNEKINTCDLSKVQLVLGIIWKAFIVCASNSGIAETTKELVHHLSDYIKRITYNYSRETDIKEKNKIKAKTGQNQEQNEKRRKVNQVKAKVKVKLVKTGHGFRKSMKNQSRRRKYLIGPTRTRVSGPGQPTIAITFDLSTVETEDSLRIGDEHLDNISEIKSDEFVKFSVENLVPSPSESEDLSDSECDVLVCDDFTTFSNLLFDANDNFSSSDDESFSDEDISKEIYSNPLFDEKIISMKIDPHHFNVEYDLIESLLNHHSSIISSSSKIDSFLNEFAEFNSKNSNAIIKSFSPSPILMEDSDPFMEEIDLFLASDGSIPSGINSDYYDSEGDILILEELLSNNSLSLSENESFDFDIPSSSRPLAKLPDDDEIKLNSGMLTIKVVGDISKQKGLSKIIKKQSKPDTIKHEIAKIAQKPDQRTFSIQVNKSKALQKPNGERSNKRRVPNIVEPEIRTIKKIVSMVGRTMEELLQAPTEGYGEAIVILEILADNFEIKTNLLQLVQTNKFHGFERDNPYTHISNFKRMTATLKYRDVPNDAIKLMLLPYSLEGAARIWYEKEPPNLILTWDDLVNKFVNQLFPPSKTTHLKNKISRFTQRFEETFGEAWERFKEMLRACPHHGFSELTQIDTFYNGLNEQDQDSLNAAADLVEIVNKQVIIPATAKAVEKTCVICRGAHAYYDCIATNSNQPSVCASTGTYNQVSSPNRASHQIPPPGFAPVQNNPNRVFKINLFKYQVTRFNQAFQMSFQASISSTLPSNTVPNPKGEMKAVTTRSGLAYEGPSIPTNSPLEKVVERNTEEITEKEHSNCQGSTGCSYFYSEPDVPRTQPKPTILYPSRLNDRKLYEKATNQMEKFFQIFHDLHFDISFADALLLMPKFASRIKSLLTNKYKLFELEKVPLNENCSAMLLKKLLEKLGDPELTPTRMTLELADKSITRPKGVAEDVFFKEITLRVNNESVTFNLNQIMRYSSTYDDNSMNRVDVIDIACEEFVQDVLDFHYNSKSSNPTLVSNPLISESDFCKKPIVKSSSPTLTPFGESDFFLEEIEDFLNDESIPTGIEDSFYDPEGDILYLEKLLNEDPFQLPPMDLKQAEETKAKIFNRRAS
uniref:Zinc finger, CCHC-type n=1 Tax=Tanacetum cinerariifolium TaxID=118510 RepID=A0A6L2J1X1_TANCI|nr:zinc finger, CCHC-type [Tanacetum cinerariifolium]